MSHILVLIHIPGSWSLTWIRTRGGFWTWPMATNVHICTCYSHARAKSENKTETKRTKARTRSPLREREGERSGSGRREGPADMCLASVAFPFALMPLGCLSHSLPLNTWANVIVLFACVCVWMRRRVSVWKCRCVRVCDFNRCYCHLLWRLLPSPFLRQFTKIC